MPRPTSNVTVMEDTSFERLIASELQVVLRMVKPWLMVVLVLLAGWLAHVTWGHMPAVPWAVAVMTLTGCGLGVYSWQVSRLVLYGRVHSTMTVAGVMVWLTVATITGPFQSVTGGLLGIVGSAMALSWDLRLHARRQSRDSGADSPAGRLSAWFADAAKEAGIPGTTLQVKAIEPTRVQATAMLPPGEKTAADLQSRARNLESGGKLPPGSLQIAEDPDRADRALVVLSDPRMIRNPVPWPGPSLPGASIAKPLRPGIWQDGLPVQHTLPGHHVHFMGSSGAGKSEGGCWCTCAEIMTRYDAAILGADLTKHNQTFGPLETGLHRVEYTRDGARAMLTDLHKLIPRRTEYLADHSLTKWVEGCGLTYLIPWLEETPDIFDALTSREQEWFLSDVKALRSAGGTFAISLQRSDWTQIPTIVRGQMASICFGLYKDSDERFGLSEKQREMGASPASWGTDHPGMAYFHAPGTPPDRVAMPMRYYAWGDLSSKETHDATAAAAMAAHAANYPASARPVDDLTAAIVAAPATRSEPVTGLVYEKPSLARPTAVITRAAPATQDQDDDGIENDDSTEEAEDVITEYLRTDDPTPELEADIDDPIEEQPSDQAFEFDGPEPLPPAQARDVFAAHLAGLREQGKTVLAARDFRPIMRPGMGRAWIHARLNEAVDRGELAHNRDEGTYEFRAAA
jgi:hypothetical protein